MTVRQSVYTLRKIYVRISGIHPKHLRTLRVSIILQFLEYAACSANNYNI